LIYKGYKKTLEETDLWKPSPRHVTSSTMPLLDAAWKKETAECDRFVVLISIFTSYFSCCVDMVDMVQSVKWYTKMQHIRTLVILNIHK